MSDWIEIKAVLSALPEDWSPFADAFEAFGCPSSQQLDNPPTISGYLANLPEGREQAGRLAERLRDLGAISVVLEDVPDQDWNAIWRDHFKPRKVGARVVLVPTWETYRSAEGDLVVTLDPGQAFGTGDHPTTRLCLELMQQLDLEGQSVLDVGCGSGVLSIAAKMLGAGRVLGSDIDPLSVEISRENATLNQVELEFLAGDGFVGDDQWDVVLSNIISATLIRLAGSASESVRPGGVWIVSGIIEANWPGVQEAAERVGFTLETQLLEDGWVGATFRR
ncbi:MAG TPA: 50S ribosomal protein L11 methyltransferase [Fimbriimonadaceae bacterium]|nr:50S ribosomal protein L11 methyltransferase [Fimbriimonadaceae bacterium]